MPNRATGDFGSAQETFSIAATAGTSYNFSTSLADLTRAQAIAKQYQHYRVTMVEMRFKPGFDTFPGLGATAVPYLLWKLDKSGVLGSPTGNQFEQLGVKPTRFDDKVITRKWKPAVVLDDANPSMAGIIRTSPWLPILDPQSGTLNTPKHHGCAFNIGKMNAGDGTVYDVDIVVHIQFKRPFVNTAAQTAIEPPRLPTGQVEPQA